MAPNENTSIHLNISRRSKWLVVKLEVPLGVALGKCPYRAKIKPPVLPAGYLLWEERAINIHTYIFNSKREKIAITEEKAISIANDYQVRNNGYID